MSKVLMFLVASLVLLQTCSGQNCADSGCDSVPPILRQNTSTRISDRPSLPPIVSANEVDCDCNKCKSTGNLFQRVSPRQKASAGCADAPRQFSRAVNRGLCASNPTGSGCAGTVLGQRKNCDTAATTGCAASGCATNDCATDDCETSDCADAPKVAKNCGRSCNRTKIIGNGRLLQRLRGCKNRLGLLGLELQEVKLRIPRFVMRLPQRSQACNGNLRNAKSNCCDPGSTECTANASGCGCNSASMPQVDPSCEPAKTSGCADGWSATQCAEPGAMLSPSDSAPSTEQQPIQSVQPVPESDDPALPQPLKEAPKADELKFEQALENPIVDPELSPSHRSVPSKVPAESAKPAAQSVPKTAPESATPKAPVTKKTKVKQVSYTPQETWPVNFALQLDHLVR